MLAPLLALFGFSVGQKAPNVLGGPVEFASKLELDWRKACPTDALMPAEFRDATRTAWNQGTPDQLNELASAIEGHFPVAAQSLKLRSFLLQKTIADMQAQALVAAAAHAAATAAVTAPPDVPVAEDSRPTLTVVPPTVDQKRVALGRLALKNAKEGQLVDVTADEVEKEAASGGE